MTQTCKSPDALAARLDPGLFRALSDPTRVALVACLARCCGPASVSQIASCCSVDLSVVSRHLATLAEAGVIEGEREGRQVRYTLRFDTLAATLRALADAVEACRPGPAPRRRCAGVCCSSEAGCCP